MPHGTAPDRKTAGCHHVSSAFFALSGRFVFFQLRRKFDVILEMLQQGTINPDILLFWLSDATDRANSLALTELGNSLAHWRLRFRAMFASTPPEDLGTV